MTHALRLGLAALVALGLVLGHGLRDQPMISEGPKFLRPGDSELGERTEYQQWRREWIERLHRHAPGQDWRQMDADFRSQAMIRKREEIHQLYLANAAPEAYLQVRTPAIGGTWVERGGANQAGRTLAAEFDVDNNRLNVLTQGGHLWRANRSALDWNSPSDGVNFFAPYLVRLSDSERLVIFSETPEGIFYSEDGGVSWFAASGLSANQALNAEGLAIRDPSGTEVYALRSETDNSNGSTGSRLYASSDRAMTFTDLGFVGKRSQTALFSPRYGSGAMYLLDGLTLKTITSGSHSLVTLSTIAAPPLQPSYRVTLSGGVQGGTTFLYAFIDRGNQTSVYQSLDGGQSWTAKNSAPTGLFRRNSAETSTRNPQQLFVGGVDAYRSHDGGNSWQLINRWQDYYIDPASKLHGDVPNFDVFVDGADVERVLISTDGGIYESTDGLLTVQNLSLSGLRNAEYYGSYTSRTEPYRMMVGSQDQGYQKAYAPVPGLNDFVQEASGDWGYLGSANDGESVWMVYPGFVMLDTDAQASGQAALQLWSFDAASIQGAQFLAPLQVDPANPNRALLAGGESGPNANRLIELNYNGDSFSHAIGDFDFGAGITAIQFSSDGLTQYVIANVGNSFYRNTGAGFVLTASALPLGAFFGGNCILVHPTHPETIFIAGAGYAGPAVYRSTDNGDSFNAFAAGMPNTLVYNLAMSADGQHLFAATELGPYYYDQANNVWIEIRGALTPDQNYWHVDYIDALHTARFSTGGRGLWDFVVAIDPLFANGFE